MHRKTKTELEERQRSDSIQDEARAEKQEAIDEYHLLHLYMKHPDYNFRANDAFMLNWLKDNGKTVTPENLEDAFQAVVSQLAQKDVPYKQQVNLSESRALPQQINRQAVRPPVVLNYTKEEILRWSPEQFRKVMSRGPEYVAELNRILALNVN